MKILSWIIFMPLLALTMAPPVAPAVAAPPFFNNKRTLISFAQSVVMGTCKPYDRDKIFCLEFPDYKTPHILSYVEPAQDAHYAIRYIIDLGQLKSAEDLEDPDHQQIAKVEHAIAQIQEAKENETLLADMAMARFFHFWKNDDLYPVTPKDRARDMDVIKQNRAAFFNAIATNNSRALQSLSSSSMVKKPTRPLLEVLDKMIEYLQTRGNFKNYAPENSDEEIF